jgi:hypothetical protein
MNNSPKDCTYNEALDLFNTNNCASRLSGASVVRDCHPLIPSHNGYITHCFEEHTSKDGTCIVQYDAYFKANGDAARVICNLEVDGIEYRPLYGKPRPLSDGLSSQK